MINLWDKDFAPKDIDTPEEIISNQCIFLGEKTGGRIVAKISNYIGPISDYIKQNPIHSISNIFGDKKVEIQEDLGEVSLGDFTFEFFITSLCTPNYKYRVMFLQYGIAFYPVHIVLDETIATELKCEPNIECNSQNDFEETLKSILGSKKIEDVINALLTIDHKKDIPF